ncbi:MAG: hypothetical protein JSR80_02045 [Verrucomicrobia bacterium]|nr:hypothetical protein [Verrucomicrobiota bacterium]
MKAFLALVLFPLILGATEFAPWFAPLFEPDLQGAIITEHYPDVSTGAAHPKPCIHHNNTLNSVWGSFMISPWFNWDVELELQGMHSSFSKRFFFDYGKATARYLWLDDVAGAPFSLTTGISITLPSHRSLRELGAYHLGHADVEVHLALGKELCSIQERWKWRVWAFAAVANSRWDWPHLRGKIFLERNVYGRHFFRLGTGAEIGFGDQNLTCPCVFTGYAPIRTRSAEVQGRYTLSIPSCFELWIDTSYRFFAFNYPLRDFRISLGILYPLSI